MYPKEDQRYHGMLETFCDDREIKEGVARIEKLDEQRRYLWEFVLTGTLGPAALMLLVNLLDSLPLPNLLAVPLRIIPLVAFVGGMLFLLSRFILLDVPFNKGASARAAKDPRIPELRKIFEMLECWDEDVHRCNRLLKQEMLGFEFTAAKHQEIQKMMRQFQEQLPEMRRFASYAKHLLNEGPLGAKTVPREDAPMQASIQHRAELIRRLHDQFKETRQRLIAEAEVNALTTRK